MEEMKARLEQLATKLTSITAKHKEQIEALELGRDEIDQLLASRRSARSCMVPACREPFELQSRSCMVCHRLL